MKKEKLTLKEQLKQIFYMEEPSSVARISVKATVKYAWKIFRQEMWTLFGLTVMPVAVEWFLRVKVYVPRFPPGYFASADETFKIAARDVLLNLAWIFIASWAAAALALFLHYVITRRKFKTRYLFNIPWKVLGRFFLCRLAVWVGSWVLFQIIRLTGSFLLLINFSRILEGLTFWVSIWLIIMPFAMAVERKDILQAFGESITLTKYNILRIALVCVILVMPVEIFWFLMKLLFDWLATERGGDLFWKLRSRQIIYYLSRVFVNVAMWSVWGAVYANRRKLLLRKSPRRAKQS